MLVSRFQRHTLMVKSALPLMRRFSGVGVGIGVGACLLSSLLLVRLLLLLVYKDDDEDEAENDDDDDDDDDEENDEEEKPPLPVLLPALLPALLPILLPRCDPYPSQAGPSSSPILVAPSLPLLMLTVGSSARTTRRASTGRLCS